MEKALLVNGPNQVKRAAGFDRIYFGSEFCQNRIPPIGVFGRIAAETALQKKGLTLLTPYVTDSGMERIEKLLCYLDKARPGAEVVFNDWGVFYLIKTRFKNVVPVLGRLLTKQNKDPRAIKILTNRQERKIVFDAGTKNSFITIPRKVPPSLLKHFKSGMINTGSFHGFLADNRIRRVEVDNPIWTMEMKAQGDINVSLYYPYAYITTTRLCGLVNLSYARCGKSCRAYRLSLKIAPAPAPFYIRGNSVFYKTALPGEEYLKKRHINRIVYESEVP